MEVIIIIYAFLFILLLFVDFGFLIKKIIFVLIAVVFPVDLIILPEGRVHKKHCEGGTWVAQSEY